MRQQFRVARKGRIVYTMGWPPVSAQRGSRLAIAQGGKGLSCCTLRITPRAKARCKGPKQSRWLRGRLYYMRRPQRRSYPETTVDFRNVRSGRRPLSLIRSTDQPPRRAILLFSVFTDRPRNRRLFLHALCYFFCFSSRAQGNPARCARLLKIRHGRTASPELARMFLFLVDLTATVSRPYRTP